jgi:MFS family permease
VIVSSSVAAWGVSYCVISTLVGRIVRKNNVLPLILAGGLTLILASTGFLVFDGLYTQLVWLVCSGIGAALLCTPFQLLAKEIESGSGNKKSGTVKATAFYTMTWSIGFASGPLAFAGFSVRGGFFITLLLASAVTLSVMMIAFRLRRKKSAADLEQADETADGTPAEMRYPEKSYNKLALLGWLVGGLGTVIICQIRTMWPRLGVENEIPQFHIAYIMALVSYSQALTAFLLQWSKGWMYRKFPALLMTAAAVLSLVLFLTGSGTAYFYPAAALFGVYSGCFYFYLVYHSLAHPSRNKFFVAGNEVIVGVVSMLSPLIGGVIVDKCGFTGAAFVFGIAVSMLIFLAQMYILNPDKLAEGK